MPAVVGLMEAAAGRQSLWTSQLAALWSLFPGSVDPGQIEGKPSAAEAYQLLSLEGVDLGVGGCDP